VAVTPDPSADPRYAAVASALEGQVAAARRNTQLAKEKAAGDYAYQQALLQREKPMAQRNLAGSLLSRGVYRSGQAERKGGELEADYMLRDASARNSMTTAQNAADAGLTQQIGEYEGRVATERADAVGRLTEAARVAEERQRAIAEQDRQIAESKAQVNKDNPGLVTYDTPEAFAAAAQAYADAVARNEAAAAQAAAYHPPAPRSPARPAAPRAVAPPVKPRLTPLSGRF
jgi:hypothetical protein